MAEVTKIEWTATRMQDGTVIPGATFNPWEGCVRVSPACLNCYAAERDKRYHAGEIHWGKDAPRKPMSEAYWKKPLYWDAQAKLLGVRRRVFCGSLCDIAEDHPSETVIEGRKRLVGLIENTPHLDWLTLTKRPENFLRLFPWGESAWPENIVAMTTVENQKYADQRIPHLLAVPTRNNGLSCEPLLGPLDLSAWLAPPGEWKCPKCRYHLTKKLLRASDGAVGVNMDTAREICPNDGATLVPNPAIKWVIAGGESGGAARPSRLEWFRDLRDQCVAAGIPFHFKQFGEHTPYYEAVEGRNIVTREYPDGMTERVGKHKAGRVLDGRTWDQSYNDILNMEAAP